MPTWQQRAGKRAQTCSSSSTPHKFSVLGIEVDIIPFGGNESDRTVRFADGSRLDFTGIREAHSTSVPVRLPKGTEVRVASPAALTALKILAWTDRHDDNPKDGLDLAVILSALSESPFASFWTKHSARR